MGKRRGKLKFKNICEDEDVHMQAIKLTCNWKKDRRLRKKILKRCSNIQFEQAIYEVSSQPLESVEPSLPKSVFEPNCDHSSLNFLSTFVNNYLAAAEDVQPRSRLKDFYVDDACLTLQVAPYLCRLENQLSVGKKTKLKSEPLWLNYERFATNLLPGGLPLPSWAWPHLCPHSTSLKGSDSIPKLRKEERQQLKYLRVFQASHKQRLNNLVQPESLLSVDDGESCPPNQRPARGKIEILHLLSKLPRLIHVKADECSRLDVIASQPTVVFFRYSCLAVEPASVVNVSSLAEGQLFNLQSVGRFLVRIVQRSMLVALLNSQIMQEDVSVMPATAAIIHDFSDHIAKAVTAAVAARPPALPSATAPSFLSTDEDQERQRLVVAQLSEATGMNAVYSRQCLVEHGFDMAAAMAEFEQVKAGNLLPLEAFLP